MSYTVEMVREKFLSSEWQKYPAFDLSDPPVKGAWFLGKIQNVKVVDKIIELQGRSFVVAENYINNKIDSLGSPVPIDVCRAGDVVAYNADFKAVFLLSPFIGEAREWNSFLAPSAEKAVKWQAFLQAVHSFFYQRDFSHWLTPALVKSAGVDANIDFFRVHGGRTGREYCLPTSPEFELKKALVMGVERIYEVKSCFRDDDRTPIHKPEFTMLEWYRCFSSIDEIQLDVLDLINYLIEALKFPMRSIVQMQQCSIADLFKKYLDFELTPATRQSELKVLIKNHKLDSTGDDDWNDTFFRLYVDRIEPHLKEWGPLIVNDFPPLQRSLARLTKNGWADRFEFFWNGVEIANAYHEENNPETIEKIIRSEFQKRARSQKEGITFDDQFVAMMKWGLPPCAGIALGLERLFMILNNKNEI